MYTAIGLIMIVSGILILVCTFKWVYRDMKEEKGIINKLLTLTEWDKSKIIHGGLLLIIIGIFFLLGINIFE